MCLKVLFWGLFYFWCISTISLTVVFFFEMVMYADDTTLYCNIDSGHTSSAMINDELKKISMLLAANKLSLYVRKTMFFFFIRLENLMITQFWKLTILPVSGFKNFRGLHINNNLTWDTHQNHISLKISKITGTMNRLKYTYLQHILHNYAI